MPGDGMLHQVGTGNLFHELHRVGVAVEGVDGAILGLVLIVDAHRSAGDHSQVPQALRKMPRMSGSGPQGLCQVALG